MVERYYNNEDKIAVLYSPRYGSGWSAGARSDDKEFMIFDRGLVELAIREAPEAEVIEYLKLRGKDHIYTGGWDGICVEFMVRHTSFNITDFDGYENIKYSSEDWMRS